jgi:hypothetical protein
MHEIGKPAASRSRIAALLAVALLLLVPAVWIAWSLHAAALAAETAESQSLLLAGLRQRLAGLGQGPEGISPIVDSESIYLPGETPALAGAALQRLIADIVEAAGGRLTESEFASAEPSEEDPGRVDLRVSFETEIESLQRILFELETDIPILLLQGLDIRAVGATEAAATESPTLRVVMLVGAYWETEE